jgi:hypothetical protein
MTAQGHIVNNPSPPTEARASINFVDVVAVPAAEALRRLATDDRRLNNVPQPSSRPTPQPSSPQPPSPPSRFSLLEVDADIKDAASPSSPQAPKASTGLAALQQELRAEREAKRALAAAQTPPGRFDLLECDLPAVPAAAAVKPAKAPQRPAISSPLPRRPVETITDLTTARSPRRLRRSA